MNEELISKAETFRSYYPEDNKIGQLLDEMITDLRNEAPRDEVLSDARAIQTELGYKALAFHIIEEIIKELTA